MDRDSDPSPIENRIGQVFVPVSDMAAAIGWYSRLLGLPVSAASHEGRIYDLPMAGDCRLALDAHDPDFTPSSKTLFFLWTVDIEAAERFLIAHQVVVEGQIEDIGTVAILGFRDPDGNRLMVCQRKG
jgi:predicted enzyme related to lactoylglutathione lyase